mgnify:CR=1 FL=1
MNKPQVRVKDSRTIIEFNPYDFEGYPRILTTFSADTITLKELAGGDHKRLSALGEKLAEMHMYAHTDDENDEYISDMDMKIVVNDNDIFSIERDEFYLEFSVLFYTGYHWYIITNKGREYHSLMMGNLFGWKTSLIRTVNQTHGQKNTSSKNLLSVRWIAFLVNRGITKQYTNQPF